ncbi:MAG: hypothetical protein WAZ94_13180 [Phycisphaerales bacterium]
MPRTPQPTGSEPVGFFTRTPSNDWDHITESTCRVPWFAVFGEPRA